MFRRHSLYTCLLVPSILLLSTVVSFCPLRPFRPTTKESLHLSISAMKRTSTGAIARDDQDLVFLEDILSSCIDASLRGCGVIRKYKQDHATVSGSLKEAGEVKSVVTQADIDAQFVIISGLRGLWGEKLEIVGEEDDNQDEPTDSSAERTPLRTTLLEECVPTKTQVPIHELTLFVDPVCPFSIALRNCPNVLDV